MATTYKLEKIISQIVSDINELTWVEKVKNGVNDDDALRIAQSIPFDDYAIVLGDKVTEMPEARPVGWSKNETVINVHVFMSIQNNISDNQILQTLTELFQNNCWEEKSTGICLAATSIIDRVNPAETLTTNGARMMRYYTIELRVIYFESK